MKVDRLDHLVITVRDVEAACLFYSRVLGMEVVHFGTGRKALKFGSQKINLHPVEPHAFSPTPGSADLCFITSEPISKVIDHLEREGISIIEGR